MDMTTPESILKKFEPYEENINYYHKEDVLRAMREYGEKQSPRWVSVKDRLPDEGQIVDIWEMPTKQTYDRAVSLKGTAYGDQYYGETYYSGWRSTNYKYSLERDKEGEINVFTKCNPRFLNVSDGYEHREICVENGEVTHWMPLPAAPDESESPKEDTETRQFPVGGVIKPRQVLFDLLAEHGGTIESTGKMDLMNIQQAQASGRFWVDENGYGYVWMPGGFSDGPLPTTPEEVTLFEKWFPLKVEMPESLKTLDWVKNKKL